MSDVKRVQEQLASWLRLAPVVPILTMDNATAAVAVARALVAGGLPVIEVTLRTGAALDAVRAISREVDGAVVGAGTILSTRQLDAAREAGARFGVSPGSTPALLAAAVDAEFPYLPGASTPAEVMALRQQDIRIVKFFPAAAAGGVAWLRALAAPMPDVRFCATGGIDAAGAKAYLALSNVIAVGGSWLAPPELIATQSWDAIQDLARAAAALRPGAT